tara:strand:- start:325 stop:999 length:675 start_codon:yes stop_codon:yes gene_type:complete
LTFLCINTSLNSCSISLASEKKNIITLEDSIHPPSDIISILVKKSLEFSCLNINDISGIITITGPGNYTSIRVGIAFSLGVSKSKSTPVYGISALEAITIGQEKRCKENQRFLTSLKSLKNEFFLQFFSHSFEALGNPFKSKLEGINDLVGNEDLLLLGPGSFEIAKVLNKKNLTFYEDSVIDFQKVLLHIKKNFNEYNDISPLYLSNPIAEKKDISWFVKKEI